LEEVRIEKKQLEIWVRRDHSFPFLSEKQIILTSYSEKKKKKHTKKKKKRKKERMVQYRKKTALSD